MSKPYMCGDEKAIYIPGDSCDCAYTIEEVSSDEYAKVYHLMLNGSQVGDPINVPFDMVVDYGEVRTVIEDDVPYEGAAIGDQYIYLGIAHSTPVYVPLPAVTGKTSAFDKIIASSGGSTQNYVSSVLSDQIKLSAGSNVNFTMNNDEIVINASNSSAGSIFPVDSVYVTYDNTSPASALGGTWSLIDKEYQSLEHSLSANWNTSTASPNTQSVTNCGHSVRLHLSWDSLSAYSDTQVMIAEFTSSSLGLSDDVATFRCYAETDGGNAIGICYLDFQYPTVTLYMTDVIGTSSVASGNTWGFDVVFPVPYLSMADAACDKFYWRRTA